MFDMSCMFPENLGIEIRKNIDDIESILYTISVLIIWNYSGECPKKIQKSKIRATLVHTLLFD